MIVEHPPEQRADDIRAASALAVLLQACSCAAPPDGEVSPEAKSILFVAYCAVHCAKDYPRGWVHSYLRIIN